MAASKFSTPDQDLWSPPPDSPDSSPPGPGAPEPPRVSLKGLALRGASWTFFERVSSQVLRLAGNVVLTRLLFPEAFGITATIAIFQQALQMLTDIGTGASVIQNPDGHRPRFLNTAFTIQVIRGLSLTVVAAALAWPAATWWFRKPSLAPMLAFTSLNLAISAFTSNKEALAIRNMSLGPLAWRNLAGQVTGLVATVLIALQYRSPWAVVVGGLFGTLVHTVLSHVLLDGPASRFCWDREAASQILRFGRWIFVSTTLTFLGSQGDRFMMARYLGEATFGLYNIASVLCMVPAMVVQMVGPRVVFPALSRIVVSEPARLPSVYGRVCLLLYAASMPFIGLFIGAAPLVVDLLFDDRYRGAGWIARLLAFRAATDCLAAPGAAALLALGLPRYSAIAQATRTVFLLVGIPLAFRVSGLEGAVVLVSCSGVAAVLVIQRGLMRQGLFRPSREALALVLMLAGMALGFGLDRVIGPLI